MKIPRDLTGHELIRKLRRLTTLQNGEHHITVPNHDPLKVGTLSAILSLVAEHFNISREELLKRLF